MGRRPQARSQGRRHPTAASAPARRVDWLVWLCAAALVLLGAIAFANSLGGAFIIDDFVALVDNPDIRNPWSMSLLRSSWGESALLGRPLVTLTFAINFAFDGLNVRGYHVGNIVAHVLCALALFGVILRIRQSVAFAFACASLWMLHPLNSEVVNYISQRTESMMALFYLSTIYACVRAHASGRPRLWVSVALAATVLGTLSKQSMVTIPFAVLLLDYALFFDSFRSALRSRWRLYLALAAVSWLVVIATVWISPPARSVGFSSGPSPWVYLLNQSVIITRYLRLSVWPRDLVSDYGAPLPYTVTDVLPQMLLMTGLLALSVLALWRRPKLGFLGIWVFLTLGLTSSFAPMAHEVGAERRMYLPLTAIVVLGVLAFTRLSRYFTRHGLLPVGAVSMAGVVLWAAVAAAFGAGTIARNRDYSSALGLAQVTFDRWPTAYTRHGLATELLVAGRREEAISHLREAIGEDPRALFTLGETLFADGHQREARELLEEFVRLRPLLVEAVDAKLMIGRVLFSEGRLDEAAGQFRQAVEMRPAAFEGHLGLADVLAARGDHEEAITEFRAYFAKGGANHTVLRHFATALARTGRVDEAIQTFRRVIELDPGAQAPHRSLAALLLDRGDVATAVSHAERAVALNPSDASAHDLLGIALAAQGRPDLAARQFREALRLDPSDQVVREHLDQVLGR